MEIINNIEGVVEVDKIMTAHLPEHGKNSHDQGQAYEDCTVHGRYS
jgi:hypothetical protein